MVIPNTHHDNRIINLCNKQHMNAKYIRKFILEIDGEFNYKTIEEDAMFFFMNEQI